MKKTEVRKNELTEIIRSLKNDIRTDISKKDPKLVKLNNIKSELDNLENQTGLFEQTKKEQKEQTAKKKKLEAELAKLTKEVDDIRSNAIYRNAFEWRFEFPEVLNSEGEYEGFDVVIGNPPYMDIKGLNPEFVKFLFAKFESTENRINLYSIFLELGLKILRTKGIFYFINPNSILMNSSYSKIRKLIFDNLYEIIKLPDNVFSESDVKVRNYYTFISKGYFSFYNINLIKYRHNETIDKINNNLKDKLAKSIWKIFEDLKFNIYLNQNIQRRSLLNPIINPRKLANLAVFSLGITPYDKYKGHSKEIIENRKFHSSVKLDENYKPTISGEYYKILY